MKSVFIFISLLIMLCPAFSQSRMEHYLDSLGLVNVGRMDPTLKIDLMYTRADNFTGKVLYEDLQEAYLHPEAAKALLQAQKRLKELYPGYSLIIYDAARPMSVQQKMWNVVKGTSQNIYVSNPARGGGLHNYGLAVDVSIADEKGNPLPMGTKVDHLGKEAHIDTEAAMVQQGIITASGFCIDLLNFDHITLRNFVLLSTCCNNCVHNKAPPIIYSLTLVVKDPKIQHTYT